jgi:hypothetical protein
MTNLCEFTSEGQHEYAAQYLRRELASVLWTARSGRYDEEFLLAANEYTRTLVMRCPDSIIEAADKLQHKVLNCQVQIILGAHNLRQHGVDFEMRPRKVDVNGILPKVQLAAGLIG